MGKKIIYLAMSVFVAFPYMETGIAASNTNQLVTDAQNAGTILKWAISAEGSADFKVRPYNAYNFTKQAVEKAERAAQKLTHSEKLSIQAKLVEPKIHIKRAQAYIDAITSSEKIINLMNHLQEAIYSTDMEKIVATYHTATAEYRKQTKLLDRVYGQSTRDGVRNAVKPNMEKLIADIKYDVTVKMYLDNAENLIQENDLVSAGIELDKAYSYLKREDVNFTYKNQLIKSYSEMLAAMPLKPLSATSDSKNTIKIKFSKAYSLHLSGLEAGQFKVSDETVQSASLSTDKKAVILTTSDLNPSTNYEVSWNDYTVKFTTPTVPDKSGIALNELHIAYLETTNSRTYTSKLTNADGSPYIGRVKISLMDASSACQTTAVITSVNGSIANVEQEWVATTDMKGNLVYTIAAATRANEYTPSVTYVQPTIQKLDGDKQSKKAPITHFYQLQYVNDSYQLNVGDDSNHLANEYLFANNFKYKWDSNDQFFIQGQTVTQEVFKNSLSTGDSLVVDYKVNRENSSSWNILLNVANIEKVRISNPARSPITYDGFSYIISGTAQVGYSIKVYRNDIYVGMTRVDANGNWSLGSMNLIQNESNVFKAYQYAPGKDGNNGEDAENPTSHAVAIINEGAFTSTSITLNDIDNNGLSIYDTLTFTFMNDSYDHEFKQALSGTIMIKDNQGRVSHISVDYVDSHTLRVEDFISRDLNFDNTVGLFLWATTGLVNQDQLKFDISVPNVYLK